MDGREVCPSLISINTVIEDKEERRDLGWKSGIAYTRLARTNHGDNKRSVTSLTQLF